MLLRICVYLDDVRRGREGEHQIQADYKAAVESGLCGHTSCCQHLLLHGSDRPTLLITSRELPPTTLKDRNQLRCCMPHLMAGV